MTYSEPAPTAARRPRSAARPEYGPRATYGPHRHRRGALVSAILVLLLAAPAFTAARHMLDHRAGLLSDRHGVSGTAVGWPRQGQAAFVLGNGRLSASTNEQPVPIASLAKVMTAYLVLERYPLSAGEDGFTVTITAAEAQAESQDAAAGESVVAVRAGERLTERQLLEALLIPSGNNIAQLLATLAAGSQTRFIGEMNAQARAFGMDHTTYTDPSGFHLSTVSTAADQLRVFREAMSFPAFRQIVSMGSVTLPVAGTLANFNPLIAEGYAGKTGSDAAAGGCLAFFTHVTVGGRRETAVGVVLGQGQGSDTKALLMAAGQAAEQLVVSATQANHDRMVVTPGAPGGRPDVRRHRHRRRLLIRRGSASPWFEPHHHQPERA